MTSGLDPTEATDEEITVIILDESGGRHRITCSSFEEAITVVYEMSDPETFTKIENRAERIVFNSQDMDIENWDNEWQRAK